ncbi:MAG: lipid-A-disaccharide synthase [Bacteroidaceae bacterium]
MKYFLIVGEASGDLHASHLMQSIRKEDHEAEFCFFGGDLMSAEGGVRVKHYKEIAYMGFIPVLLHIRPIFKAMKVGKRIIDRWKPHLVILVDYPGFNLSIAEYVRSHTSIPVFYYIAPKIWAWKEHRIKSIRNNVDELFAILPFEVPYFKNKHHYPVHYLGNPTVDEVSLFQASHHETFADFLHSNNLPNKPIIALLAGSRKQEIKDNLTRMYCAAQPLIAKGYQLVLAAAPNIDIAFYRKHLDLLSGKEKTSVSILFGQTYRLLQQAEVALVTSGTATLETALFRVPQVVCYYTAFGKLFSFLHRHFLSVKYVSLVNLIVDREVVPERIAADMRIESVREALEQLVKGGSRREEMLQGYEEMHQILGPAGSSARVATEMVQLLRNK